MPPTLSIDQVNRLVRVAEEKNKRDALVFKLIAWYGFKLGEVVGTPSRRMDGKKWVPMEPTHHGLKIQDLGEDGILVSRKSGIPEKRPLKPKLVHELRELIGDRDQGKIFEMSESRVLQLAKEYAREARLPDWKRIRPHMLQDFYDGHQADITRIISTFLPAEPEHYLGQRIDLPGLTYAPTNEQGVVFVFGMVCHDLQIIVEHIQTGYPDAEAIDYRHDRSRGVRRKIEFEFRSSSFKKHDQAQCDIIVCWEHDWKDCPKRIEVI